VLVAALASIDHPYDPQTPTIITLNLRLFFFGVQLAATIIMWQVLPLQTIL
jgi:hypothetical protein